MSLALGTRIGPYEITKMLGAGGMGEVYRARDPRLGRDVAIKILPSLDIELKARFAVEARAIASLSHPHICTLYDVGQQDATDYLVMEHLEGQTLAARLERGPLKLVDALRYATEIADALDKAHRAGVVHRDLKPANIMLTDSGAKLLDFGVAKLRPSPATVTGGMATVTASTPLTGRGIVVGTPQYMAPEQLEGKEADTRSDLFALGAILYEMVTGRKAFEGSSPASLIAAIMSAEPPFTELRTLSPPGFDHLVKTCLMKNPGDRRQTAHDVVLELQWIANQSDVTTAPPRAERQLWKWIVAAAVLVSASAGLTRYLTMNVPLRQTMRVSVLPPENEPAESFPAISPDGSRLAFSARGPGGETVLWLRPLESSSLIPIAGTEGARDPFWSPDSRSIGFFAHGKLKIVGAGLGSAPSPVQTLAEAPEPRGGTWSPDGVIIFARNIEDGLYRVLSSGGDVTAVTTLDRSKRENSHRWPQFLPDGRHLLFFARSASAEHQGIYVGTPGSSDWKLLLRTPLNALVVGMPRRGPPLALFSSGHGYLLFMREQTVLAQPFDLDRLELSDEPSLVAELVGTAMNRGMFSASGNSTLAYRVMVENLTPAWFDRAGKPLGTMKSVSGGNPRLSPDGKQIAFVRADPQSGAGDIWLEDVSRGRLTRLTSHPGYEWIPIWSPDGSRVAFASNREGTMDLYEKAVSGSEQERLLLKSDNRKIPTDWSRDQEFLLFQQEDPKNGWDLWALPVKGERKPFPLLTSEFDETWGALSPDGEWLAYTSDETGDNQIYVQRFMDHAASGGNNHRPTGKLAISADGGVQPHWRADGKELFYLGRDGKMMSVTIKTAPSCEVGTVAPLFAATAIQGLDAQAYDVTSDGQRFLITATSDQGRPRPVTLFLNWTAALRK
jgi:eukaryotic-like serine/threonine-protein kinase